MKKFLSHWYQIIIFGFIIFAGLVFIFCGENSIIAVHDNLDLFTPQFQMMKNTGSFFGREDMIPFLGGISRDSLPAEFSLYTILYMIFPSYAAYIVGYILKILIALYSCILLGKELYSSDYSKYKPLIYLTGFAYGILNLFPAFGIPFASIPLAIWLLLKIYREPKIRWYVLLFFYPLVSYFSYFGMFILAYMVVAFLWIWIKDRKFPLRILTAIIVLSLGCIACEYRLFGLMLLGDEETIRATIVAGSYSGPEIIRTITEVFAKGMFHAESMHTYLILPICVIYFFYLNICYIRQKNTHAIFHDLYNLLALVLVFNSVIYGIYYWEGFRNLVEAICPPLTGWQFNRTVFFSPFIWYAAFFLVLKRLYDSKKKMLLAAANILAIACVLIIICSNTNFNDLYHTCFNQAYSILKDKQTDQLSYKEFYSTKLFEEAKKDLDYSGQWSAAYGFYPAVLEYNGISTLDGYLGFYSQEYKDEFRRIIAPALDRMEATRAYYDEWGARAYLYSGTDLSIVSAYRTDQVTDRNIYIDLNAFKDLGGRYIFSRIELKNAEETGLILAGTYTNEESPYTLYVYQTASVYQDQVKKEVPFQEMQQLTYDESIILNNCKELEELAKKASEAKEVLEPEKVLELYSEMDEELTKLSTCYAIADILYYENIYDQTATDRQQQLLDENMNLRDKSYSVLQKVCSSPYKETMETVLQRGLVKSLAEYEELTEREKEISREENKLIIEYEQAAGEDYTYQYNGKDWTMSDLADGYDDIGFDNYIAIYQGISKNRTGVLGEIYLKLVQLRDEEAKLNDYDNYAEYAYSEMYVRDYTLKDVNKFCKEIKKDVSPTYADLMQQYYAIDTSALKVTPNATEQEIFTEIQPYIEAVNPELSDGISHLLDCDLCDFSQSSTMANVGFTQALPYYQDGFIMNKNSGDYVDYTTAIHEFGHYNQIYHSTESYLENQPNIDVKEIHSQGLEMLCCDYYDDLFGEEGGDAAVFSQVYRMLQVTVSTAIISEFENEVYKHPDMTVDEMNKLYYDISMQYGNNYVDGIDELYDWADVNHIFSQPCYCISYATSALSSLDILTMAREDRHKAIESYMQLSTLRTRIPYCSAVKFVGLRDIFKSGVTKNIIEESEEILKQYS